MALMATNLMPKTSTAVLLAALALGACSSRRERMQFPINPIPSGVTDPTNGGEGIMPSGDTEPGTAMFVVVLKGQTFTEGSTLTGFAYYGEEQIPVEIAVKDGVAAFELFNIQVETPGNLAVEVQLDGVWIGGDAGMVKLKPGANPMVEITVAELPPVLEGGNASGDDNSAGDNSTTGGKKLCDPDDTACDEAQMRIRYETRQAGTDPGLVKPGG